MIITLHAANQTISLHKIEEHYSFTNFATETRINKFNNGKNEKKIYEQTI